MKAADRVDGRRDPVSTCRVINPVGGALRLGVLYDLLDAASTATAARRRSRRFV
ncbi:MAG: hypothetical protein IPF73_17425 [Betaproteobacteria bacterium]|nr:hypothetical protein [Betaproteobacteria bacterium]